MDIYITRNGQQFGPFSEADLRQRVARGEFSHADLAWHEPLPNWVPLVNILGAPAPAFAPPAGTPVPVTFVTSAPAAAVAPAGRTAPTGLRILTAAVLFVVLFVFLFVVVTVIGLFIGGLFVGFQIATTQHPTTPQDGYNLGHAAGVQFGQKWAGPIFLASLLISLVASPLLAWKLAFSNLFPWCRPR